MQLTTHPAANRALKRRQMAGLFEYDICKLGHTDKVTIDFGDGFCLSRVRDMNKEVYYAVDDKFIIDKINKEKPEILIADNVTICNVPLNKVLYNLKYPKSDD